MVGFGSIRRRGAEEVLADDLIVVSWRRRPLLLLNIVWTTLDDNELLTLALELSGGFAMCDDDRLKKN